MKLANTLILTNTLILLSVIAMREEDMKISITELLTYIYQDGSRSEPNIGIAAFPASSYRYLSPLRECENAYPNGQPLGWMLFPFDSLNEFRVFMDDLKKRRGKKQDCRPQPWCSLYSSSKQSRRVSCGETDDLPTIVNGRLIVGINKSSNGSVYHVAYHDYATGRKNTVLHRVSNHTIIASSSGVLFRNLSILKEVYQKWKPRVDGPLLINYSTRRGIFYTSLTGKPMHELCQDDNYKVMVCEHDGFLKKCKRVKRQTVLGMPSDYCVQCKGQLYGRHCQFDPDECSEDDVHEFGFFYVDCRDYKTNGTVLFAEAVVVASLRHNCSEHSTCVNTFGSYFCFCDNGWTGEFCEIDIDECEENLDNCNNETAPCQNTPGSYKCATSNRSTDVDNKKTSTSCTSKGNNDAQVCKLQWILLEAVGILGYLIFSLEWLH